MQCEWGKLSKVRVQLRKFSVPCQLFHSLEYLQLPQLVLQCRLFPVHIYSLKLIEKGHGTQSLHVLKTSRQADRSCSSSYSIQIEMHSYYTQCMQWSKVSEGEGALYHIPEGPKNCAEYNLWCQCNEDRYFY